MDSTGIVSIVSSRDVTSTLSGFIDAAKQSGFTIFGQFDLSTAAQGANAAKMAKAVVFGSPKMIAHLINVNQQFGIDLPTKVLVWQRDDGKAVVSYNDPHWLIDRHSQSGQLGDLGDVMTRILANLVEKACKSG